jgi:hypothetical protein
VSSSTSNGHANKNLEVPPVQVEHAAATRIQAAFRAYRVHMNIKLLILVPFKTLFAFLEFSTFFMDTEN